jgi:uncharacterized membrane protein YhaH (DUF805 family)
MAADQPPERAQRYARRIYWTCAGLTAAVGAFLVADVLRTAHRYSPAAWIGVALSALAILSLVVVYAGCAAGRFHLDQRLAGKLTLFQATAVCLVVAVGADILIPARNTGGLALLLPWGISYWLHNLNRPTD